MEHGRIKQVDAPYRLYENPATPFISSFVGKMNRLSGTWCAGGLEIAGQMLPCEGAGLAAGDKAVFSIRPEKIALTPFGQGRLDGRIKGRFFLGSSWFFTVETAAGVLGVSQPNLGVEPVGEGAHVALHWSASSARAEKAGAERPAAELLS